MCPAGTCTYGNDGRCVKCGSHRPPRMTYIEAGDHSTSDTAKVSAEMAARFKCWSIPSGANIWIKLVRT